MLRTCAQNLTTHWVEDIALQEPGIPAARSPAKNVQFHVDRPASFLLSNLSQEFTGWLAVPKAFDLSALQFAIGGEPIEVQFCDRPDVQRDLPNWLYIGWTFHLDHKVMFGQPQRTLELSICRGDERVYSRHFYKSKELMPAGRNSPLFFMHIPKTGGTALRQFTDYAFGSLRSMLLYGDFPGFPLARFSDEHWQLAKTRELIFGHFDFDFVRTVTEVNPKIVVVFREPLDLIRSYLLFNGNPAPEFIDNPLVRHVCGLSYTAPFGLISERHLQMALDMVERHYYVLQQEKLQQFADTVTTAFDMPGFRIPRINQNSDALTRMPNALPFDVRFDRQLYESCRTRSRDFLEFLNA